MIQHQFTDSYTFNIEVVRIEKVRRLSRTTTRARRDFDKRMASDQAIYVEVMGLEPTTSTLRTSITRVCDLH